MLRPHGGALLGTTFRAELKHRESSLASHSQNACFSRRTHCSPGLKAVREVLGETGRALRSRG